MDRVLLAMLASVCLIHGTADAKVVSNKVPDNQKASITVQGAGVLPNAKISLSTGPKQTLVAQADKNGNFTFANLAYSSFTPLKFALDIPPNNTGFIQNLPNNHINFSYDPRGGVARITGNIGKSGTLSFQLYGSEKSRMQVAGAEGEVRLQSRTALKLASGSSRLIANIINVGEMCCPRMVVPASPITLTVSSVPMLDALRAVPKSTAPATNKSAPVPYIMREEPKASPTPVPSDKDEVPAAPKKKKIPYIVQGAVDLKIDTIVDTDFAAAVSFSAADYERTYVGGLKKIADEIRNAIMHHVASLGAMMDGRNLMDTLRSLQNEAVDTMKNYTPSESICRFGTLSRSLVKSQEVVKKNHLAFTKLMFDRNNQIIHTLYSNPIQGITAQLLDFKKKYCDPSDNGLALKRYCEAIGGTADLIYNRDVDFTRLFDVPLTIDADFTDGGAVTNDQRSLVALFENLSMVPPFAPFEGAQFDMNKNSLTVQDMRAVQAARDVAQNTFGALVAEKVKSPMQSAVYIKAVLAQLGLGEEDITRLVGDNPSYFAQMEIMTKKLFQDPSFYAELYDSPANIDRQRVAMKAVELQQNRDLLESLRRREMLLSVLLNLKLRDEQERVNSSSIVNNKRSSR